MKKIWNYLRSMRFGILLLILIALCSLIGSLIPQGEEIAFYAERYPGMHPVLLVLQLHHIFQTWYFLLLAALLALNLTLCSVLRIFSVVKTGKSLLADTARLPDTVRLTEEGVRRLEQHLQTRGCRKSEIGGVRVYCRNRIGRYGSFLTHLALLLTLIFATAGLYLPRTVDQNCMPGESVSLNDGLRASGAPVLVAVDSFRMTDTSGRLDYASRIRVTLPDGRSREGEISVNHPLSFGAYKIYQQSYGTAGSVTVTNLQTGGSDRFLLPDPAFLTLDGVNGLWILGVYPDYSLSADGVLVPKSSSGGAWPNPVYLLQRAENGEATQAVAFPGDTMELGGLGYRFDAPEMYPGLRVKYTPPAVNALLFASFALLVAALFITFFLQPVLVKADDEGYAVGGPKPEGMRIELRTLLSGYEKEGES